MTLKHCNCRNKDQCPLEGNCLESNVVYCAKVTVGTHTKHNLNIGSATTKNNFGTRNTRMTLLYPNIFGH